MLSRVSRSAHIGATRRTLSTAVGQSSSGSGQVPIITVQHERPTRWLYRKDEQKATLWVRPWDGITSMPEGLAIMRALERKYGKLKHFFFLRDQEVRDMYQPFCFAELESNLDLEQIPIGRQTIQLEIPVFERPPPAGVGLESIHGLLHPEQKAEDFALLPSIVERVAAEVSEEKSPDTPQPTTRIIDVHIERSARRQTLRLSTEFRLNEQRRLAIAKSVVQWGGFYAPPPPSEPVSEEDVLMGIVSKPEPSRPQPSRPRMEAYLRDWQPKVQHLMPKPKPIQPAVEVEKESAPIETMAEIQPEAEEIVTTSVSAEAPEPEDIPIPEPESEQPRISKRRERLLELARKNARTPLPESVKILTPEEEEQKRAEIEQQKAEAKRTKDTVRDRLWKLMGGGGGNWL